jgi:hypothetical protein
MAPSKDERETHCYFNEAEGIWRVWTEVAKHARRLERMGWKYNKSSREWVGSGLSVLLRPVTRKTRTLSERQKKEMASRLSESRKAK